MLDEKEPTETGFRLDIRRAAIIANIEAKPLVGLQNQARQTFCKKLRLESGNDYGNLLLFPII